MQGFQVKAIDYSLYETSLRRWLVQEVESGRMTWQEARSKFNLNYRFDTVYKEWQRKYSNEIVLSLPMMTEKERIKFEEQDKRIKVLEKQLEYAQMKNVAINTLVDIAEKELKIPIRKKSGSKQ